MQLSFVPASRANLAMLKVELVAFNDANDFVHVSSQRLVVDDHMANHAFRGSITNVARIAAPAG